MANKLKDVINMKKGKVVHGDVILSSSRYSKMLNHDITEKTKAMVGLITSIKCARYYLAEYTDPQNNKTTSNNWAFTVKAKKELDDMLKEIIELPNTKGERDFLEDITTCQASTAKYLLDVLRSLRTEESMDNLFLMTANTLKEILVKENALVEQKKKPVLDEANS